MIKCLVFADGFLASKISCVGGIYFLGLEFVELNEKSSKSVAKDFLVHMLSLSGP